MEGKTSIQNTPSERFFNVYLPIVEADCPEFQPHIFCLKVEGSNLSSNPFADSRKFQIFFFDTFSPTVLFEIISKRSKKQGFKQMRFCFLKTFFFNLK